MLSVIHHYASHLGPVYTWMAGGLAAAVEQGAAELDTLNLDPSKGRIAVDLGAGFGMHAIPLARRGYQVLAIDSCANLINELESQKGELPIQIVEDDLLAFRHHIQEPAQIILCMGDTITHLENKESVLHLVSEVATSLKTNGHFVVTFRDYSIALTSNQRFIPVRNDENKILTCFLEYADMHITVHDLLHEREAMNWKLRVSNYRKLRLSPEWLASTIESFGFLVRRELGLSGMVRLVAQRI